jgi:hypothetical protein
MKEQVVSLETAKLAKEKGFNISLANGFTVNGIVVNFGRERDYHVTKQIYLSNKDMPMKENVRFYAKTYICTAPTQSLLQKWLREEHNLHITVEIGHDEDEIWYDSYVMKVEKSYDYEPVCSTEAGGENYETALEEGLIEALKLI